MDDVLLKRRVEDAIRAVLYDYAGVKEISSWVVEYYDFGNRIRRLSK